MELRLLGPIELVVADRPVELGPRKQRAVLAMLALEAGRTVSADRLAEGLWSENPPASAPKMVQLTQPLLGETLLGLAAVIARQGDLERAARLAGAAHGLETDRRARGEEEIWQRLRDEFLTPATERLGHTRWSALERETSSLTPDQAIDLALASASPARGVAV